MQPIHHSMHHPKYSADFYVKLNAQIISNLHRVGHNVSAAGNGDLVPMRTSVRCVKTGYDVIGLTDASS